MSDVCKLSAGGPAPRDGCSCRSCVDARLAGRTATHECVAGMGGWCITCRRPVAGRATSPEPPRLSVTGGDDDVMAHCTCGWYDTVPAGTAWGHFAWLVSQHAQTHRRQP